MRALCITLEGSSVCAGRGYYALFVQSGVRFIPRMSQILTDVMY